MSFAVGFAPVGQSQKNGGSDGIEARYPTALLEGKSRFIRSDALVNRLSAALTGTFGPSGTESNTVPEVLTLYTIKAIESGA